MAEVTLSRDAVAGVLMVHWPEYIDEEVGFVCGCDERGELYLPRITEVTAHQADAVLALRSGGTS